MLNSVQCWQKSPSFIYSLYKNTENCKPDLAGITDQYMAKLLEETDKDIAKIVKLLQLSFMNIPKISELNKDDFVAR